VVVEAPGGASATHLVVYRNGESAALPACLPASLPACPMHRATRLTAAHGSLRLHPHPATFLSLQATTERAPWWSRAATRLS
jgi:hypothetical protein